MDREEEEQSDARSDDLLWIVLEDRQTIEKETTN